MILFVITLFQAECLETTQRDFADGWFERNIYSSHRGDGAVEFSLRWDANQDEWMDITNGSSIFWGSGSGFSDSQSTSYSGWGGSCYADINTDGYTDFINSSINIYWGNSDGPVMIQAKMDKESGFECIVRLEPSHVCLPYYKLSCGLKSSVSSLPV